MCIPDAPLPTGHTLFSRSAEGVQNSEVPVAGPAIQQSLENDVMRTAGGVEQLHKGIFIFVLYNGTNDLYHGSYACATGQKTDMRVLERSGEGKESKDIGKCGK